MRGAKLSKDNLLQEREEGEEASGESTHAGSTSGGSTGVLGQRGCGGVTSEVGGSGGLGLAVGDLGDYRRGGLRLTVRDLSDNRRGSLRLTVGDLSNDGGGGLGLAIGDLGNDGSRCLGLTIRDLSNSRRGRLGLAVRNLGYGLGSLGLTVWDLGDAWRGTLAHGCLDVDGGALSTNRLVVQVVETTRLARVEHGGALEGKGAVAAETKAFRFESTCLNRRVKLELLVGSDVSGATSLVSQLAVLKSDHEDTIELALVHATLGGYSGGIDGGNGEFTTRRSGTLLGGGSLGVGSNSGDEAGSDEGLHLR